MLTASWERSLAEVDRFKVPTSRYRFDEIVLIKGCVLWQRVVPADTEKWSMWERQHRPLRFHVIARNTALDAFHEIMDEEDDVQWSLRFCGFETGTILFQAPRIEDLHIAFWRMSYWWLITPLALFSAFLLLDRRSPRGIERKRLSQIDQKMALRHISFGC